ncbi:glycosyltransferase family 4 protein [Cellulophaga sp. E16_2]|uniref:glycosyltransferase family 4 protein n=1 Tax=unclassified Cellulophaga TaxID=2634405 RepID=UPI0013FDF141|nr:MULTISPECIES: glycosyltransferase family 4 protein [unclassified Cellulophaga]MBO0592808.1 glycosyltransferase family 4 protein [Cellulophaga sp. E16_2]
MKKIIFLALGFPDVAKYTNLYTDLIHEFHNNGHDVLVLAPAENKKEAGLTLEGGVSVLRVATLPLFNVGILKKGLANLLLSRQYKKALKKHKIALDFDLILMPTPPITLTPTAEWIKNKSGAKLYLILRDIFPQNAVDLKMMDGNGAIHSFFRKKEVELYQVADYIGCMSPANITYIEKHNAAVPPSKLHLLPNWENLPNYKEGKGCEALLDKYKLKNKFIVIFGGNIGRPQKMENIIALAKECQEIPEIMFFIIGTGTEKQMLTNLVQKENLANVILEDKIPKTDYNDLLRLSDVGLISLSEDFTIPNFPSKVLSYFGNKKPVLASVDLNTDFGTILEEVNAGYWAAAGATKDLKEKLLLLYHDKNLRAQMGENGYAYMEENLLPNKAYKTIITITS